MSYIKLEVKKKPVTMETCPPPRVQSNEKKRANNIFFRTVRVRYNESFVRGESVFLLLYCYRYRRRFPNGKSKNIGENYRRT